MKNRKIRNIVIFIIVVGLPLLLFLHPGGQRRMDLLTQKIRGYLPGITWTELAVRMIPNPLRAPVANLVLPSHPHWIQKLVFPEIQDKPWAIYTVYDGPTTRLEMFDCHVSVLKSGVTPHPPHQHVEEELLMPLKGNLAVIRAIRKNATASEQTVEIAAPGQIIYHAPDGFHTIRAEDPDHPATYLVFKWRTNLSLKPEAALRSSIFSLDRAETTPPDTSTKWVRNVVFEGPTPHLAKLHGHISLMKPGGGYDPHSDPYDVAIVLLSGAVETLDRKVDAPSVIFYSANRPHGLRNAGTVDARYLVMEFHAGSDADNH